LIDGGACKCYGITLVEPLNLIKKSIEKRQIETKKTKKINSVAKKRHYIEIYIEMLRRNCAQEPFIGTLEP
jgi:hypothetical protein